MDASVDLGVPVALVAAHHDEVAERFDLPWLMAQLAPQPMDTYWEQAAKAALREEITEQWIRLTRAAVTDVKPATTRVKAIIDQVRAHRTVDMPMLVVAARELRRTAAGEHV